MDLIYLKLIYLFKKLINKNVNISDYSFEEVGNFIYTVNLREIEKFMLGRIIETSLILE